MKKSKAEFAPHYGFCKGLLSHHPYDPKRLIVAQVGDTRVVRLICGNCGTVALKHVGPAGRLARGTRYHYAAGYVQPGKGRPSRAELRVDYLDQIQKEKTKWKSKSESARRAAYEGFASPSSGTTSSAKGAKAARRGARRRAAATAAAQRRSSTSAPSTTASSEGLA